METWLVISISISISMCAIIKSIFASKLPPGPVTFPIIGNFLWLTNSVFNIVPILRSLHSKFGPIVTLHIGSRPAIFISDRFLTHKALIENSVIFANRPPAQGVEKINTSNQHTISSAFYGPTWRLLRLNLTSKILHPSLVMSYSQTRKLVLQILKNRIESEFRGRGKIQLMDHFQYAMFCLSTLMCFGDDIKVNEDLIIINKIKEAQRGLLLNFVRFSIFSFWPRLTKILFRKRWEEYLQIRQNQRNALIPLIRARKDLKENQKYVLSYVDTLLDLQLTDDDEKIRKLEESEIVTLCSEFLTASTDTTSTALQWIMANLVKYPCIQNKLFAEIKQVVGDVMKEEVIKEDDLQKMLYLKAVILEGLRRYPPTHLVVPHAVTEDTMLNKYLVPINGTINFMVAEIGWDSRVWKDPMAFKPERFLSIDNGGDEEVVDLTGIREIKMMPFGLGRRMCPGYTLAMLHLEYFVANLVWSYEWKPMKGDEVDLSEKQEFTVVMKYPLQAQISPRSL